MKKLSLLTMLILVHIASSILADGPVHSYVPTEGLVAYYPFNGDALDYSGNGWNGVINGTPTYVHTGSDFSNQAIQMNGSTDYVALDTDVVGGYFSVGLWLKTTTVAFGGEDSPLLARLRMYGFALFLNYVSVGDMGLDMYNSETSHYVVSVNDVTLNDGRWHHICVCYGPDRGLDIYIDGTLRLSDDGQGTAPIYTDAQGMTLSRDANIDAHYYPGLMDEVVFYDHALSADDVDELYAGGWVVSDEPSSWGGVKALFR